MAWGKTLGGYSSQVLTLNSDVQYGFDLMSGLKIYLNIYTIGYYVSEFHQVIKYFY